jgi:acyl-CoA synthetase (AMP-forming)/AMP-acid ligase II
MERFHPVRALDALESLGITRFMGVPSMFASLLPVIARRPGGRFVEHTLRLCLSGGAVVSEELQNRWYEATGVELRQGYGLTEAGPAVLLARADHANRRAAMGSPLAGTEVTIRRHDDGAELDTEVEGEICVRGPHVSRGYVHGGSAGLPVRNGWLHTGDIGVKHADGTYSFRGLIKPMFTRNGFNIYPREIEAALLRMPGVRSARAWALPDAMKENGIAVRIEGAVNEADVKQWAQHELAAYKVPGHYEIVGG